LIGMGEMGRMYAKRFVQSGWKRINVCDRPERFESLREELKDSGLNVLKDGHLVSRCSDFVIYSVEAEHIDRIVAEYGPSTKVNAIVSGQTSVKDPERAAFERHLPADVHIISLHSLHGPSVSTEGQALIVIRHRATDEKLAIVEQVMSCLGSRFIPLSYEEHDEVTANTQAVTHAAFLSMGTAWRNMGAFPWETGRYAGGVEVVKTNICLRIYSQTWHVYAGLAILNPSARIQIQQYARSATELLKLMMTGKEVELRQRVMRAKDFVFGGDDGDRPPLFVSDTVFDRFAISSQEASIHPPNSHLSLLAMADCWERLKIRPFRHLDLAATPIFRLWFGVAQYLFNDSDRLEAAIRAGCRDMVHRPDDLEFVLAARSWSECVNHGSFGLYRARFEETAKFFEPRFEESRIQAQAMLKAILADQTK